MDDEVSKEGNRDLEFLLYISEYKDKATYAKKGINFISYS